MYHLVLHKNLTPQKWSKFTTDQQLFMIGNELNRALNLSNQKDKVSCFERAFELVDLTISCQKENLRRELLRWRELLAETYLKKKISQKRLQNLFKALLYLNKKTYSLLICSTSN